jgi:phage baseplate assembly protein W
MLRLSLRNAEDGAILYDSDLPFVLDFGATGIREIVQNLVVLMLTPIYSQCLDRELGLDMSFVDRPMQIAQNMVISEIVDKVPQFEDRVEVTDVEFLPSAAEAGHLYARLTARFLV